MESTKALVPITEPSFNTANTIYKKARKESYHILYFFLALYLISTLLGVAIVPERLFLSGENFVNSFSEYGALILCGERCFLTPFLLIFGFTFLRFPACCLYILYTGVFTGICIRLCLYNDNLAIVLVVSVLFSLQILLDLCITSVRFYFSPLKGKKVVFSKAAFYFAAFALYPVFSYLVSFLICLMYK